MNNYKKDDEMNIETTGLIEWPHGVNLDYFRTESTSYKDLDRFIHSYVQPEKPHLVDFGSGKEELSFILTMNWIFLLQQLKLIEKLLVICKIII